jgi:hypothetical protein
VFAATGRHTPASFAQLWQAPQLAAPQQVPSTQVNPAAHSFVPLHADPCGFSPHVITPPIDVHDVPALQSADWVAGVQLVLHVPLAASHTKFPQLTAAPVGQAAPVPSQVAAFVPDDAPAEQVAARHTEPARHFRQPPLPSQKPSLPQLETSAALQRPSGSAAPSGSGEHVPGEPASAQLAHTPSHAELQQTPSTQKPDRHSPDSRHAAPLLFLPHRPPTHLFGAAHCESSLHDSKQAVPPALHT